MVLYQTAGGYENLILELFGGYYALENVKIHQKINEHATIELTAIVTEQSAKKYETEPLNRHSLRLVQKGEEEIIHFGGMLQKLIVERKDGIYFIHVKGVSFTKYIDIQKQNVSYQNENSTYKEVVEKALQEYSFPGYAFLWTEESRAAKVGRFLLQFQETDWEFIKRVASIEHLGLIPDMTGKQPRFFIGLPKGREEKIVPPCKHTVHRLLEKAEKEVANDNVKEGVWQGDYLQYRLYDVIEHYDIGDVVRFAQEQYIVVEKTSILKKEDGILRNDYVIQKKKGISFPRLYNHALRGNSLTGTVIDVKRNFTKLHLHIDQEGQEIKTAFWFPQPQYFTAGSDSGFCIMPERGDMMRLHFPTKDESEHYIICSDNGDFGKLFEAIHASRSGKEEEKPSAPPLSDSNAPYEKYLSTPGKKGMLLNDGMIKYHTTGDISIIQIEDGKGVTISSEGNIELLANNISLNGGEKIKLSAEKKIEMTCGGSSIVIDGEEEREDFKAMELYLESPLNVDVDIMPPSEAEKIFRAFAEKRKAELPQFTPDGIPITMENKFDDAIYHYLYAYWKEQSGEYDPKDDEIIMTKESSFTKNEKKFEQWLFAQYGMTNKEQREYTFKGNLLSLGEIALSAWGIEGAGATKLVVPGKFLASNADDTAKKALQQDTIEDAVEGTLKKEVAEEVAENTAKKEIADTAEDLSQKTIDKDDVLEDSSGIKGGSGGKVPGEIIGTSSADDVNNWWKIEMGYDNPPYKPGTTVNEIKLTQKTTFVRVYDGEISGQFGGWVMKAKDIQGLTPSQIQDKFALPSTPKYITDVVLPEGTVIREGVVNPLEGWGTGGGIQYDLMGQRIGEFVNPRPL